MVLRLQPSFVVVVPVSPSESCRPQLPPGAALDVCAMTGYSAGAKRPGGFVLGRGVPQAPPKKVPKAAALIVDDGTLPPPSPTTLALFEKSSDLWLAIDVETHELIPNTTGFSGWIAGQFGHLCRTSEGSMSELRVVQLGWCVGSFSSSDPPRSVQVLVRPDGFRNLSGSDRSTASQTNVPGPKASF